MKRVYYLFVVLLLVACGKKHVISYNEYQRAHENTRERHIQLIKRDAEILDTLFSQDIDILSGKKEMKSSIREEVIKDVWDHSSEYLKTTRERHEIYVNQVIYNDQTTEPVQKMWSASSDLSLLEAIQPFHIKMSIMEHNPDTAIIKIRELKQSVSESLGLMLEGAEEYQKIVFAEEK